MLKILGKAASINVRKVLWTLAEIGLPYEREDWGDGFQSPQTPEFMALNPNAMVPVLVDGDFVLWESNTICRYLVGANGRDDLLPRDPRQRAQVEKWMDWQSTDLNTSWRYAFMSVVRKSAAHQDPAQLAASASAWNRNMAILEQHLQGGSTYVAGEQFTLADILLALTANRWQMTLAERPAAMAIDAWLARLADRPGFAEHCRNGLP
jgi:glutathione S-transferase